MERQEKRLERGGSDPGGGTGGTTRNSGDLYGDGGLKK